MMANNLSNCEYIRYISMIEKELCGDIDLKISRYKTFEAYLIDYTQEHNFLRNLLYETVGSYLRVRCKVDYVCNTQFQSNLKYLEERLWKDEIVAYLGTGECGDEKSVSETVTSHVASCNMERLEQIVHLVEENRSELFENLMHDTYEAANLKIQIEYTLRDIVSTITNMKSENCTLKNGDTYLNAIQSLRLAISILFCYLRKPVLNKTFIEHAKQWLLMLTSIQLMSSSLEDHWFLLFHLLRCPNNLSWAFPMIQIPKSKTEEEKRLCIDWSLSLLVAIFSPITNKGIFLKEQANAIKALSGGSGDSWIIVESDDEGGCISSEECTGLKESDLIGLLNQIPFEKIFRLMLEIDKEENNYKIPIHISGAQLLRVIQFNSKLIKLLTFGLSNFGEKRYSYFIKRLGLLIKHCIHYTYDCYQLFMEHNLSASNLQCESMSIKLDEFMLMASECLYKSRSFGIAQFFQCIPYNVLHKETLYAIFYFFNVGFPENIYKITDYQTILGKPHFMEDSIANMKNNGEEELHYLLQTFFEMAIARDGTADMDFIRTVTHQVFFIGFLNDTIRPICYKSCKDILLSLTSIHPQLLSDVINITHQNVSLMEYYDYLFKSLPFEKWTPDVSTLEILSLWLRDYACNTKQSLLSRIILSKMNWGVKSKGNLFLPRDIHIYVACIVCEAVSRHAVLTPSKQYLPKRFSSFPTNEESNIDKERFIKWCWSFILNLHLHVLDQGSIAAGLTITQPSACLPSIPTLNEVDVISQGVLEKQPVALILAIGITQHGYSIPLICQQSFDYLYALLMDGRYIIVIRYLELLTILFVDCIQTLVQNTRFVEIIQILLESKLATSHQETTFELFRNMLQSQIFHYARYGVSSPMVLVELWFEILTSSSIHFISTQISTIIPLLDSILNTIQGIPGALHVAKNILLAQFEKCSNLLPKLVARREFYKYPWYCICVLEVEHQLLEIKNNLWHSILLQYRKDPNMRIDLAFKEAKKEIKTYQSGVEDLTIFKYANIVVLLDLENRALPFLSQRFFFLYLYRIPWNAQEESHQNFFGISDKFYNFNTNLINRMETKFKLAEEYYLHRYQRRKAENKRVDDYDEDMRLSRVFNTYATWLKQWSINKISKCENIVNDTCQSTNLKDILHNKKDALILTLENTFDTNVISNALIWSKYCRRNISRYEDKLLQFLKPCINPVDRIEQYLKSYDSPKVSLQFSNMALLIPSNNYLNDLFTEFKANLIVFEDYSKKITSLSEECLLLNKSYVNALQKLFENIVHEKKLYIKCSSLLNPVRNCSKPAEVLVTVKVATKNKMIEKNIAQNRSEYHKIRNQFVAHIIPGAASTVEKLNSLIMQLGLLSHTLSLDLIEKSNFLELSQKCLFHVVENCDNSILYCTSSRNVLRRMVLSLNTLTRNGPQVNGLRIAKAALRDDIMCTILSEIIEPSKTNLEGFIDMYELILDATTDHLKSKILMGLILKLDIQFCLKQFQPKFVDVSRILKITLNSLTKWRDESQILNAYRKYFINIWEFQFPTYCCQALEGLLILCSARKIKSHVILDVINSLLSQNIEQISGEEIYLLVQKFAEKQNELDLMNVLQIMLMVTNFFHEERKKYISSSLYTHFEQYCEHLPILFAIFGHCAVTSTITIDTYSDTYENQVISRVLESCLAMYTPWVCIYNRCDAEKLKESVGSQVNMGNLNFYPWTENHLRPAKNMVNSLMSILKYCARIGKFQSVAVASSFFNWYIRNFSDAKPPTYIQDIIGNGIICFPWNYFYPNLEHLEICQQIAVGRIDECNVSLHFIFVRIPWNQWFLEVYSRWSIEAQIKSLNSLLVITARFIIVNNFEKNNDLVNQIVNFPWDSVTYDVLNLVFGWMTTLNSSLIINFVTIGYNTQQSFLSIIKCASAMHHKNEKKCLFNVQAKRALYIEKMIMLFIKYVAENQDSLLNREGQYDKFKDFYFEFMSNVENILSDIETPRRDAVHLLSRALCFLDNENNISKLILDLFNNWISKYSQQSDTMLLVVDVIALKNKFNGNYYNLLESNIEQSLQITDILERSQRFTWNFLIERLGESIKRMNIRTVIECRCLLVLHLLLKYKITYEKDQKFLAELIRLITFTQPSVDIELKFTLLWAAIISVGAHQKRTDENITVELTELGLNIQKFAKRSESLGNALLAMVGFQQDKISKKFILLARCLACLIFTLCSKNSDLYYSSVEELKANINSRKNLEHKSMLDECIKQIAKAEKAEEYFTLAFDMIGLFYNEPIINTTKIAWTKT